MQYQDRVLRRVIDRPHLSIDSSDGYASFPNGLFMMACNKIANQRSERSAKPAIDVEAEKEQRWYARFDGG